MENRGGQPPRADDFAQKLRLKVGSSARVDGRSATLRSADRISIGALADNRRLKGTVQEAVAQVAWFEFAGVRFPNATVSSTIETPTLLARAIAIRAYIKTAGSPVA